MSDTILSGDFTVFYAAENNQKRIKWTGSATGTRTLNELYSALQNLFDDPAQMDDVTPMKADTPDIYRMQNQWFIDDDSVEHLKTGALFSEKWKDGTTEHVLMIGYAQTTEFNDVDVGRTIQGTTTSDTGTILDFNTTRKIVWIRPDDPLAAGDEFDNGTEAYTIKNNAFSQVWQVDITGPTYVDETADANSATNADWQIFPATEDVGDYVALGYSQKFSKLIFDNLNGTAGIGGVVVWEYWNGTTWASLTVTTDGTSGFTAAVADGTTLTYTVPSNWATTSINSSPQLYYLRARITTVYSTNPVYDQGFVGGVGAGSFAAHGRLGSASKAGESAWAGITTIGSIEANTHIYIFQENPDKNASSSDTDDKKVIATKGTSDWWGDGHINILLKTKEGDIVIGQLPNSSPATGVSTVLARQYSKSFSHFIATSLNTSGGNTVVPLSTADDLDNTTGYRRFTGSSGSGTFVVDEVISSGSKKGILTAVGGTSADPILTYYLIADPITDFVSSDAITGATSGATCTAGSPADVGPALDTTVTTAFGPTTENINNGNGARPYSIRIDPATLAIERVYERMKFITRRGSSTALQTQDGEEYLGAESQIEYTGQAGGEFVTSALVFDITAKGRGRIIADTADGTAGDLVLKEIRGTFTATNTIADAVGTSITLQAALQEDDSGGTFVDETADAISAAPGDVDPFPLTEAINDAFYLGANDIFSKTTIIIGTSGVGGVGLWEYWNGSSWSSLEAVTAFNDASADLTAATGSRDLVFSPPTDWVARTVGAGSVIKGPLYFIRLRVTTVYSTNPILDQVTLGARVTATIAAAGVKTITPVAASPFGTFAGGKFFGARGVTLTTANLAVGDEQAYQLIDNDGNTQIPPNTQSVAVTNLVSGDTVAVFRRSAANIIKNSFTLASGNNVGNTTVVVNETIASSYPTSSKIRVISPSGQEHRYRYSSFATSTFTLATASTGTGTAGSNATTLVDSAANFTADGVEVGDYVRNTTEAVFVRVTAVNSATSLTTETVGNWTGDSYSLNTLVENYALNTNAYVPFIERIADATSESISFIYSTDIDVRVDVRKAGTILPFSQDTTVVSTGLSVAAIRNADTIFA